MLRQTNSVRSIPLGVFHLLLVGALTACGTTSSNDSPGAQPTPDEDCSEWRIEVRNGGPAEVSVYYMKAGRRSFLDIVGPHSMRTFFVTFE